MKIAAILLATCFATIYASDVKMMEILSSYIVEAEKSHFGDAKPIPELAGDLGLNELVTLVKKANLVDTLSGAGPFTVFGPTDKAFGKLPKFLVKKLLNDTELLTKVLKYHVAPVKALSTDLSNDELVKSEEGADIRINIYGKVITASGRVVSAPNKEASNGVIHEVDSVLFPPPGTFVDVVSKCPAFSKLLTAVKAAEPIVAKVLSSAGNLTLFAPTDCAFEKIPKSCLDKLLANKEVLTKVLEYHVVPNVQYSAGLKCGECLKTVEGSSVHITKFFGLRVNHAKVIAGDVSVTNGVFHAIDSVLIPHCMAELCPETQTAADNFDHPSEEFPIIF